MAALACINILVGEQGTELIIEYTYIVCTYIHTRRTRPQKPELASLRSNRHLEPLAGKNRESAPSIICNVPELSLHIVCLPVGWPRRCIDSAGGGQTFAERMEDYGIVSLLTL